MRSVRRSLPQRSNLLGNIGSAQEIQKIKDRSLKISNLLSDRIREETGIQSFLEEQDIKDYLNDILDFKEKAKKL